MTSDEHDGDAPDLEALDDEAPPEIPDISSERPPTAGADAAPGAAQLESLDDEDVADSAPISHRVVPPPKPRRRFPTSPQTPIARSTPPPPATSDASAASSSAAALKAPLTPTLVNPASSRPPPPPDAGHRPPPVSRSPEPPRPVSEPPRPVSDFPRALSEPPAPISEPPEAMRPVSEPPRAVSEPPRAVSEPAVDSPGGDPEPTSRRRARARMVTIPDDAVRAGRYRRGRGPFGDGHADHHGRERR